MRETPKLDVKIIFKEITHKYRLWDVIRIELAQDWVHWRAHVLVVGNHDNTELLDQLNTRGSVLGNATGYSTTTDERLGREWGQKAYLLSTKRRVVNRA
jgi:hypothetical protein